MRSKSFLTIAAFLAGLCATPLAAESHRISVAGVDEVVVSGYRPERASELGSSVSVFGADALGAGYIGHFEDVIQLVPNMNLSGEGSRARYFQIRGIGEREQYEGAPNPSVGFFIDDIDLSGIGGIVSNFDLERIEVLRGPQSTQYGSSALAGVVYAESSAPTDEFGAQAEIGAGSDSARYLGLAAGGPISGDLSGRVSIYSYEDDGFRRNAFLGRDDTNARDELTLRGKLSWAFAGGWSSLLTVMYADADNGYDAFALDNGATTFSDEPGEDSQETTAASLRIQGEAGNGLQLLSISSVANSDIVFAYDGDWENELSFLPIVTDYRYRNPRERDSISQEVRLQSLPAARLFGATTDWVLGAFWRRLDEDNRIDSTGEYIETAVGCDPGVCITDRQITSTFSADTLALFGGLDSQLSGKTDVSFGLRIERWDAEYADNWIDNGVIGGPVTASNFFDPDDTLLGGHVALGHDLNEELRLYARIARGFKAGGFNPSLAALGALPGALGPEFIPYTNEYLWNYEAGLKFLSATGSLAVDISAYFMDRDDAQLSQSSQVDPIDPNSFFFVTSNGDADVIGLDASFAWQVNDPIRIHGSLGLLNSEIDDWSIRPAVTGRDLAHAPSYTVRLGVDWDLPAGWFVRADATASDSFYFDISHDNKSQRYELVNVSAGRELGSWAVTLWGRNIFDENYSTRGFFFGNEPPLFNPTLYTRFGSPRQVGITLQYEY